MNVALRLMNSKRCKKDNMCESNATNPAFAKIDYPMRGPLRLRIQQLSRELDQGIEKPFDKCILHIGDLHALKAQKPLTFARQVLSLMMYPELLMDDPRYPQDVKDRAHEILSSKGGYSIGSYTESQGNAVIRQHISEFLLERDGYPTDPSNIYMTNGGSVAIQTVFNGMMNGKEGLEKEGYFIAFPVYCLYQGIAFEIGSHVIPYFLDEDKDWQINTEELESLLSEAKKHCQPKMFVLTNPGNPTGNVLPRRNIEDVIKFCHRNQLVLFADEVYQDNIYTDELPFYSCRQVMFEMGSEYTDLKLISLHCSAKGCFGEAALRGAYFELHGFNEEEKKLFYKKVSTSSCPNILGQVAMSLMCKPPKPGELSYELYSKEKKEIMDSLKEKATITTEKLNKLPGVTCNRVTGAFYAFPKLTLPPRAIEEAKNQGVEPDYLYASGLLEETGILVMHGSAFGQLPGTAHFRITILPPMEDAIPMFERIEKYHLNFMSKYS